MMGSSKKPHPNKRFAKPGHKTNTATGREHNSWHRSPFTDARMDPRALHDEYLQDGTEIGKSVGAGRHGEYWQPDRDKISKRS